MSDKPLFAEKNPNRTLAVLISLTADEKAYITRVARARGVSVRSLLRWCLRQLLKRER